MTVAAFRWTRLLILVLTGAFLCSPVACRSKQKRAADATPPEQAATAVVAPAAGERSRAGARQPDTRSRGTSTAAATGSAGRATPAERTAPTLASLRATTGVRKTVLANGLRLLLVDRPSAPVVSCVMAYHVGSVDEPAGKSGMAHFLEHVMFKGTDQYAKGEIDLLTMQHGGNNNAWTMEDVTAYHFSFAADRWEVALEIEANRMRQCLFDPKEVESEKQVVIEELKSTLDSPWDLLTQEVEKAMFDGHPYARPVIGLEPEIEAMKPEDLKSFYDAYYAPNNAVLVVVGRLDPQAVTAKVQELFGAVPVGVNAERRPTERSAQAAERRIEVTHGTAADRLQVAFPGVKVGDPDDAVLDVISMVLAGGRSARLYRRLVEDTSLASEVSCSNDSRQFPGAFFVNVETVPHANRGQTEVLVNDELTRLMREDVTVAELQRARNMIQAQFVYGHATALGLAENLAYFELMGSYTDLDTYLTQVTAVDAAAIRRVATRLFVPENRTVGWSLADHSGEEEQEGAAPKRQPMPDEVGTLGGASGSTFLAAGLRRFGANGARPAFRPAARSSQARGGVRCDRPRDRFVPAAKSPVPPGFLPPPSPPGPGAERKPAQFDLQETWQVRLDNGMTVLLYRTGDLPIVQVRAFVEADELTVPEGLGGLAQLTGEMLLEGTRTRTSRQIAEQLEGVGAELHAGATGLAIKLMSRDLALGIEMSADLLRNPVFPDERLERQRALAIARAQSALDEPDTVAQRLLQARIYGAHPLGTPADGEVASLKRILRRDVALHHSRFYRPSNVILAVVGDLDVQQTLACVRHYYGDWAGEAVQWPALPALAVTPAGQEAYLTMGLEQVTIMLGHLGIRRNDPDFVALRVMDYILGTGTGFTDRLSKKLRDELGLAYTVNANLTDSAGREPGMFRAYLATRPQNLAQAVAGLRQEIAAFLTQPPTDEEVKNAQDYLVGAYVFDFETAEQRAEALVAAVRFGLGLDYLDRFPDLVRRVTAAEVLGAAQRHLHPEALVTVVAGPVDESGQVLEMEEDAADAGDGSEPAEEAAPAAGEANEPVPAEGEGK